MTAEAVRADLSASTVYLAVPPSHCLNGCETQQSSPASKVWCEPGKMLCPRCLVRLDKWLRALPDLYALLPSVVEHGTVPSDPGTKHTKRPDPPAPMRLEVVDLLDVRDGAGVLGIVHSWAEQIREQRHLPASTCHCDHSRPTHTGHCSAIGCACRAYTPGPFYVFAECRLLVAHLPWAAEHDWIADLYDEIRVLHRTLADTVGEYRAKPVGKCARLEDGEMCGGALVMNRDGYGVHCLACGQTHEANNELRELGLVVGRMFNQQEAS